MVRKAGSPYLYLSFRYFIKTEQVPTPMLDTPENREACEKWLDENCAKIKNGTFRWAVAFPDASDKKKKHFAALENAAYPPDKSIKQDVRDVSFEKIVGDWREKVLCLKNDQRKIVTGYHVNHYILPVFKDMTLDEIKTHHIEKFRSDLKHDKEKGLRFGNPLADHTKNEITGVLFSIWQHGCDENGWAILNPFKNVSSKPPCDQPKGVHYTELLNPDFKKKNPDWAYTGSQIPYNRRVLRFEEWEKLRSELDWAEPVIKFFLLTGTIYSEVAGLQLDQVDDIEDNVIHLRQAYHYPSGIVDPTLKTQARIGDIDITASIRKVLDQVKVCTEKDTNPFVFTSPKNDILDYGKLKIMWEKAVHKSGLPHTNMYCLRHSFIGWALTIGVPIIRVAALARHSTRKLVDTKYGKYVKDLEKDTNKIAAFFGSDFHKIGTK